MQKRIGLRVAAIGLAALITLVSPDGALDALPVIGLLMAINEHG